MTLSNAMAAFAFTLCTILVQGRVILKNETWHNILITKYLLYVNMKKSSKRTCHTCQGQNCQFENILKN